MQAHIQVQNLNVTYSGHAALKNVSVEIPKGQITAIMGPSGCGKTTLLKSMNRLLELSDGAHMGGGLTDKTPTRAELSRCLNAGGMGRQDWETETLVIHEADQL